MTLDLAATSASGSGSTSGVPSSAKDRALALLASLSPRQRQVFDLVVNGHTGEAAAAALGISIRTLETHRLAIRQKLDVHSLSQLRAFAEAAGVVVASLLPAGESPTRLIAQLGHRERQVFDLVVEGRTGAEIAAVLGISEKTVETHAGRVSRKLFGVLRSGFGTVARAAAREAAAREGAAS